MTYRLQNFFMAIMLAVVTLFWVQSFASQNSTLFEKGASGGYQLFGTSDSGNFADNPLNALEKIFASPETAPECCNAPKGGVDVPDGYSFGRDANQDYHTWRHVVDDLGMDRTIVQNAIVNDLPNPSTLQDGLNIRHVTVNGVDLQYNAFKLPDGTVNIGRIHEKP